MKKCKFTIIAVENSAVRRLLPVMLQYGMFYGNKSYLNGVTHQVNVIVYEL